MKKVIGIVSEGPTDHMVLKAAIDRITGEENRYLSLQPEPDMTHISIVIPCDSTDAWVVAVYDDIDDVESLVDSLYRR